MNAINDNYPGEERVEGLDNEPLHWGDYPIDSLLIRHESRTIYDVKRRIDLKGYIMDPDFQRDFIWDEGKQSKLIESVMMRIPLPVFYLAENFEGKMIVVDGLQRLSTFYRFLNNQLKLKLPGRQEFNNKNFSGLPNKLKNRIEDCNLTFYIIDSKVPDRARLDIFERVNSGVPLTRQQMRNSLFNGEGTKFLKDESQTKLFMKVTGNSLNKKTMRDREFVNRFCAFQILGVEDYKGDMDDFLAQALTVMNNWDSTRLSDLSNIFRRSLNNNYEVFGKHAFRKSRKPHKRTVINASIWDVLITYFTRYKEHYVKENSTLFRDAFHDLLEDVDFDYSVSYGTNNKNNVTTRFYLVNKCLFSNCNGPPIGNP